MITFLIVILITCFIEIGLSFFLGYRNNWVYKVRGDALEKDLTYYKRFPSYNYMLYHKFWVFDSKKFLDVNEN